MHMNDQIGGDDWAGGCWFWWFLFSVFTGSSTSLSKDSAWSIMASSVLRSAQMV